MDDYEPLENGYKVTYLAVNDKVYLEKTSEGTIFPQDTMQEDSEFIFHGPIEISGIVEGQIVLGVVTNCSEDVQYTWYKDGNVFLAGINLHLIHINDIGVYTVECKVGNTSYLFQEDTEIVKSTDKTVHDASLCLTVNPVDVINQNESKQVEIRDSEMCLNHDVLKESTPIELRSFNDTVPKSIHSDSLDVTANTFDKTSATVGSLRSANVDHGESSKIDAGIESLIEIPSSQLQLEGDINRGAFEASLCLTVNPVDVINQKSTEKDCNDYYLDVNNESKQVEIRDSEMCLNHDVLKESTPIELRSFNDTVPKSIHSDSLDVTANTFDKTSATVGSLRSANVDHGESSKIDAGMEFLMEIPSSQLQLEGEINRGAFGVVWKAVWNETTVAVKKIPVKRMKKAKYLLQRELKINSTVRHPNIVLFMGFNIEGNELQLVSEYLNGPNLDQLLFDEMNIDCPIEKRISTGYQVCAAVTYLHSRRPLILHRDIKPENIVLSKCLSVAKLCDMGLSKFKSMTTVITTMAGGSATQPGTTAYKAPEVFLSNSSASTSTDIWSLSATLVELLTDEMIWENTNDTEEDDCSLEQYIFDSMKIEKQPDGLKCLASKDLPEVIKEVVSNGLNYRPFARPSAINVCRIFREHSEG